VGHLDSILYQLSVLHPRIFAACVIVRDAIAEWLCRAGKALSSTILTLRYGVYEFARSKALLHAHIAMESMTQSNDRLVFGCLSPIRYPIEAEKPVRQAILTAYNRFSSRSLEERAIALTFVPQGIVFSCDNDGRRKAMKILSQQGRS
jgi:hypothetical protein